MWIITEAVYYYLFFVFLSLDVEFVSGEGSCFYDFCIIVSLCGWISIYSS